MCGCEQGTCPGNCPCGCRHTAPATLPKALLVRRPGWWRRRRPKQAAYVVPDSPKMLRETLCVAQAGIAELTRKGQTSAGGSMQSHMDRLSRLIDECDRHRPLGRGGNHGNLHTPTCGCSR